MARYRQGIGPVTGALDKALGDGSEWISQRHLIEALDRIPAELRRADRIKERSEKDAITNAIGYMRNRYGYEIQVSTCYRVVKRP